MLWVGLVLALAIAVGAGAWSALSRMERTSPASDPSAPGGTGGGAPPAHRAGAGSMPGDEPLPEFALTDRSGRIVTREDLAGKVWVANFIFTRCPSVCPDLTRKMANVRRQLHARGADDVVSVSISVDPVFDTPAVLDAYARNHQADSTSWLFLTGDPDAVVRLVNDGFHLIMNDPKAGPPAHSNRFALVDAGGRVRATHLGDDTGIVDLIVTEAVAIRNETPPARS